MVGRKLWQYRGRCGWRLKARGTAWWHHRSAHWVQDGLTQVIHSTSTMRWTPKASWCLCFSWAPQSGGTWISHASRACGFCGSTRPTSCILCLPRSKTWTSLPCSARIWSLVLPAQGPMPIVLNSYADDSWNGSASSQEVDLVFLIRTRFAAFSRNSVSFSRNCSQGSDPKLSMHGRDLRDFHRTLQQTTRFSRSSLTLLDHPSLFGSRHPPSYG